jgi:hypothetical protein
MMAETDIWKKLRATLTESHLTRVENAISSGAPDVHGCHAGVDFWIELKMYARLIKFRPSQIGWMAQRLRAGGDTYVLAHDKNVGNYYITTFKCATNAQAFIIHLQQPHLDMTKVPCFRMEKLKSQELLNHLLNDW